MAYGINRATNRFGKPILGLLLVLFALSLFVIPPAFGLEKLLGVVVLADPDNQILVVQDVRSGRNLQLQVSDRTLIKEGKDYKKIGDLVSGTPVLIQYEISEDALIALTVMIQPSGD